MHTRNLSSGTVVAREEVTTAHAALARTLLKCYDTHDGGLFIGNMGRRCSHRTIKDRGSIIGSDGIKFNMNLLRSNPLWIRTLLKT